MMSYQKNLLRTCASHFCATFDAGLLLERATSQNVQSSGGQRSDPAALVDIGGRSAASRFPLAPDTHREGPTMAFAEVFLAVTALGETRFKQTARATVAVANRQCRCGGACVVRLEPKELPLTPPRIWRLVRDARPALDRCRAL